MSTLSSRLVRIAQTNPMINKELRGRMRSGRTIIVLTVYLALLAMFSLLFYWIIYSSARYRGPYDQQVGRDLLNAIVVFETLLVTFLAPAFTSGVISGERERQTFDILMTTLLKPRSIILGKMGSALAFLLLLILAVAPLQSLAFMIGGVAPEEIFGSLVVLVCAALLYGSIGMLWSSIMKSTAAATVLAYATLLFILAGVPFLWFVSSILLSTGGNGANITRSAAYVYFTGAVISTDPVLAMGFSEAALRSGKPLFIYTDANLINGKTLLIIQPWFVFCVLALLASGLLLAWSIRVLPPVHRRKAPAYNAARVPNSGNPPAGEDGYRPVPPPPPTSGDTGITMMQSAPEEDTTRGLG